MVLNGANSNASQLVPPAPSPLTKTKNCTIVLLLRWCHLNVPSTRTSWKSGLIFPSCLQISDKWKVTWSQEEEGSGRTFPKWTSCGWNWESHRRRLCPRYCSHTRNVRPGVPVQVTFWVVMWSDMSCPVMSGMLCHFRWDNNAKKLDLKKRSNEQHKIHCRIWGKIHLTEALLHITMKESTVELKWAVCYC